MLSLRRSGGLQEGEGVLRRVHAMGDRYFG